ncbi:MAG: hypothetical protein H7A10_08430 [Oceanospirillaceae bacterium]|nr:hypothetical protein [Oceanospirillaceae bacterium]
MPSTPLFKLPIVRHLSFILALKLVALFGIWYFFFSQPEPAPKAQTLDQHFGLVNPAPANLPEE